MWWQHLLWGFWNGITAWIVLIVHVFGNWGRFPFYNTARSGNWYDVGFLLGAGSPFLGALGSGRRNAVGAGRDAGQRAEVRPFPDKGGSP